METQEELAQPLAALDMDSHSSWTHFRGPLQTVEKRALSKTNQKQKEDQAKEAQEN